MKPNNYQYLITLPAGRTCSAERAIESEKQ